MEPAAIAAEPVPDAEVSPAPPSSPLPAAASASRRTPAVTASRLGPYGEPALAGAGHAVPAEGLEGAGALTPAVLQPEIIGEPLEQVSRALGKLVAMLNIRFEKFTGKDGRELRWVCERGPN